MKVTLNPVDGSDRAYIIDVALDADEHAQAGDDPIRFSIPELEGWSALALDRNKEYEYAQIAPPGQEQHAGGRWGLVRKGRWKYSLQRHDLRSKRSAASVDDVVETVRSAVWASYTHRIDVLRPRH